MIKILQSMLVLFYFCCLSFPISASEFINKGNAPDIDKNLLNYAKSLLKNNKNGILLSKQNLIALETDISEYSWSSNNSNSNPKAQKGIINNFVKSRLYLKTHLDNEKFYSSIKTVELVLKNKDSNDFWGDKEALISLRKLLFNYLNGKVRNSELLKQAKIPEEVLDKALVIGKAKNEDIIKVAVIDKETAYSFAMNNANSKFQENQSTLSNNDIPDKGFSCTLPDSDIFFATTFISGAKFEFVKGIWERFKSQKFSEKATLHNELYVYECLYKKRIKNLYIITQPGYETYIPKNESCPKSRNNIIALFPSFDQRQKNNFDNAIIFNVSSDGTLTCSK